ncbi:MAG: hypothetical protein ABI670_08515 [Chloroflexota bacterium]
MLEILRWVLGVPLLAFLLYAPGAVVLNSLMSRSPARHLFAGVDEWIFTAVLVSFLTTGLAGFILAEVGLFRWWLLALLVLFVSVLVGVTLGQVGMRIGKLVRLLLPPSAYPQRAADRRQTRAKQAALLGLIVLGAILYSRPSEMLRGALDSGAYVNGGVAIARSGSILQRDVLMRELDNDKGEVKQLTLDLNPDRFTLDTLRMPAFYVLDKKAALILPQHYSLYPAWVAVGYSLFGIWGALYMTPLITLLSVLAVYFFARRALGEWAALVGLLLLILCPVTIWFARYPVSEDITALLAFSSFFAFGRMVKLANEKEVGVSTEPAGALDVVSAETARTRWAAFWGVVAGVSLGQIALARPDFIFFLAPVPLYLIYWRIARKWQRPYTFFALSLGTVLMLYGLHFAFYGFAYTLDLYHNVILNLRRLWGPLLLAFYVGAFFLIAIDRLYPRLKPLWVRIDGLAVKYRWAWAGAIILGLAAYFLYKYVYQPWQPNIRFDSAGNPIPQAIPTTWESYIGAPIDEGAHYNLVRVGWYLSPLGMVLGVAGLFRWVWGRLSAATGLFFGSFLVLGFVFIQETYTEAHYIYTMRRFVPVILPALILGTAWACSFIWSRLRPRMVGYALAGTLVLGLSIFFMYTDRVIVPHIEEQGAVAQLDDLAGRFPPKSVLLFSNERDEPYVVATPLQYIYGIDSFVVKPSYPQVNNTVLNGVVKRWQSQGYKVWVLMSANGGKLNLPDFSLKAEGNWEYRVPEFEQLRIQKPTNVSEAFLPFGIYSLEPKVPAPAGPFHIDIGDMDYPYLVAGFNKQERDSATSQYWRWTGEQAIMRVPWATEPAGTTYVSGTVKLRLRPETPSPSGQPLRTVPVTVTVTLDNTPIGDVLVQPGTAFTDYTLTVPAGIPKVEADPENALLRIKAPTWSGRAAGISGDARVLGVQIDDVEINR